MARPSGPKNRCSGMWTESKFQSFIKNILRQATNKWEPKQRCLKEARKSRGLYVCACCNKTMSKTTYNPEKRKRENNVFVDHIEPVVPVTGWVSWDDCINRMFCEVDNLQVLCKKCHDEKTQKEKEERKRNKKNEQRL